jgi:outer membrane protein
MKKNLLVTSLILCAFPVTAAGQERPEQRPKQSEGWTVNVGAGALLSPNYLGDDAYSLSAVPYFRVTHSDRFFASVQEGAGYSLIKQENFRAGPLLRLEFGRDEDGTGTFRIVGDRTDDLLGLGDIDTSVSLGGFAEIDFGDFTASAKLGKAVSGHEGLTGDIGVSYKGIFRGNGPPIIYSFGPRINFGDDNYMSAQFGVTTAQSQASGLTPFEASGGVVSYGVSGTAIMPVTDVFSVTLIANYSRLTADAGDSSLVTERGSRDQAFSGLVTSFKFR